MYLFNVRCDRERGGDAAGGFCDSEGRASCTCQSEGWRGALRVGGISRGIAAAAASRVRVRGMRPPILSARSGRPSSARCEGCRPRTICSR